MRLVVALSVASAAAVLAACGGGDSGGSTLPEPGAVSSTRVGGTPVALTVAGASVWVADNSGSRVVRLDSGTGDQIGRPVRVAAGPEAIASGEGGVWVASGDGTVTRIDPATHIAERARSRIADPGGIAAGEGAVWVTSRADDTVTRIDPRTLEPIGDPIPVGAGPADVAVADGQAWVANADGGTVTRIDAASGEPDEEIEAADYQVLALCYGEGAVWIAKTDDRLAREIEVARIDPSSSEVDEAQAGIDAAIPVRLAAGEGGVWATLVGGVRAPATKPRPGRVALVDPANPGAPTELIRAGETPSGIAVGDGAVWVANSAAGAVSRIDL